MIADAKYSQMNDVAYKYDIDKSLVIKWRKEEKKIMDVPVTAHRKLIKKIQPSIRHAQVFKKLFDTFSAARSKGLKMSYR